MRTERSEESIIVGIPLRPNGVALIDERDSDLSNLAWELFANSSGGKYARVRMRTKQNSMTKWMHRIVLGRVIGRALSQNEMVDHINSNGLDNRRQNLRLATFQENAWNRRAVDGLTSKYKGVSWNKTTQRFIAKIQGEFIGSFEDEESAAHAYDLEARKRYGEYAVLNLVDTRQSNQPKTIIVKAGQRLSSNNKTGFRGIYLHKSGLWAAQIRCQGKKYSCGYHKTKEEAARAYDKKAIELLGDRAAVNFPEEIDRRPTK